MEDGHLAAALARFRHATELDPADPEIWYHVGLGAIEIGDVASAEAAYRKAIELRAEYAEAWCNLGSVLANTGRLDEGLTALRRGAALGEKTPNWPHPTAEWIEALVSRQALEAEVDALVAGGALPDGAERCGTLAGVALGRGANSLALRLIREATSLGGASRLSYLDAVRAAGRVAAGRDLQRTPGSEERRAAATEAWRTLSAVFAQLQAAAASGQAPPPVVRRLVSLWEHCPDLASFRAADALAAMADDDAARWREFWGEVRALGAEAGLD